MRNDFAVLILSHGRVDNIPTIKMLEKCGYTGKWYIVIDDEDKQADRYFQKYGNRVIQFNKQNAIDNTDVMDSFNKRGIVVPARNIAFEIAKNLGLKYFAEFDDDYTSFGVRYKKDTERGSKLCEKKVTNADDIFEYMLEFLDTSNALTVAFCQGGDFIGGLGGDVFHKGLVRKVMNTFFCRTDRPFKFAGSTNEDVVMYTTLGSVGELMFSVTNTCINQGQTQKNAGGLTEEYLDSGTFVKSFYSVMAMPSAVKVGAMGAGHARIHHRISWNNCVPMILNEKWKK